MRKLVRALVVAAALAPVPAVASTIVVTNSTDVTNGNTTSPEALAASPGADGVSLVEALAAVRGTPGPHTITFAASMLGQTIAPSFTYLLNQENVSLVGITDADGRPGITIDASRTTGGILIDITASHVAVSHLRFTGLRIQGVSVTAGARSFRPAPQSIADVRITDNAFDAGSVPGATAPGVYVNIQEATEASLSGLDIRGNQFTDFTGDTDAVLIANGGTRSVIREINVTGNTVTNVTNGVELVISQGTDSEIRGVQISGNSFSKNVFGVAINQIGERDRPALRSTIRGSLVQDNTFSNASVAAVFLLGGLRNAVGNSIVETTIKHDVFFDNAQGIQLGFIGSTELAATNNLIDNTQITGNILRNHSGPPIFLNTGSINASGNAVTGTVITSNLIYGTQGYAVNATARLDGSRLGRIDGVAIANNTFAQNGGAVVSSGSDALGNTVRNVTVVSSIMVPNSGRALGLFNGLDSSFVSHSLVGDSPAALVNGNSSADPRFVSPSTGDFHVLPGSPAIDAGWSDGAPRTDLEGNRRVDDPGMPNSGGGSIPYYDMGAYEYDGTPPVQPAVSTTGSGPLSARSISAGMTTPGSLGGRSGSVFVIATLAARTYALTATGGWSSFSCETAGPLFSGRFAAGEQFLFSSTPTDLTALSGAAVFVGYGLGPTAATACVDMLNYSTLTSVYTIRD